MKLKIYLRLIIMLQSAFVFGQVGIGTKMPDESSILDIQSKSKGLLIPRLSSEERNLIVNPANALILFNSTLQAMEVNIGTKSNPHWVLIGNNGGSVPIATHLASGSIFVGNTEEIAKEVLISGDASLNNLGVIRIDNDAVISKTLTGYNKSSGKIGTDDTILQAIQKLDGNQSQHSIVSIVDDYTLLLTDYTILCDNEKKSFTIHLPEVSSCLGKVFVIGKIDGTSNELHINPSVQLSKTITIAQLNYPKFFKIQSNGKFWFIIN